MPFVPAIDQREVRPKLISESAGIVVDHRQAATPFRSVERECRNDHVSAWRKRGFEGAAVGIAIGGFGKEVKNGAVVPDLVAASLTT